MSAHEAGLIKAVIARLKSDAGVSALLAGRVWDEPPEEAELPHLRIGRGESRPVGADGCRGRPRRIGASPMRCSRIWRWGNTATGPRS